VSRNILTSQRVFWSLAFVATLLFLVNGDAGSGSRSLKSLWEARDKTASSALFDVVEIAVTVK
jgi:hypothetical protein